MEAICVFLFNLVGNEINNIHFLFLIFLFIFSVLTIIAYRLLGPLSLFLLLPPIILYINVYKYAVNETLQTAATKNQAYVDAYIDSIKQETAAGKNFIVVDSKVVGRNGRKYLIEFEKDMVDKNYKVQSNNDGIVVYRKFAKE